MCTFGIFFVEFQIPGKKKTLEFEPSKYER